VLDLPAHGFGGADEIPLVVGHVDDGGDAASRRRTGRPDEVFLVFLRERMDLRIDGAGKDHRVAEVVAVAGSGCVTLADGGNLAIANGDVPALDDAIWEDDDAGEGEIEIAHAVRLPCPVRCIRTRSSALRLS
jgi:hypothetical protein